MPNLPDQLISLRKKLRLTQKQLADKVGIDQTMISDYEMGKFIPSPKTIEKFAKQGIIIDLNENQVLQIKDYQVEKMPDVSKQLINLRKSLKLSQSELAELVGVHKNTIARIERKEVLPDLATLQKFIDNKIDLNQYNEESEMTDTAKEIIKIRENLGLNQSAFARKIGVSPTTLCEIESGKRHLTSTTLKKIRDKVGVSLNVNTSSSNSIDNETMINPVGSIRFNFNIENEVFELKYLSLKKDGTEQIYTLLVDQEYSNFLSFVLKKNPNQERNTKVNNIQKVELVISHNKINNFYTLLIKGNTTGVVTFKPSTYVLIETEDKPLIPIPKLLQKEESNPERDILILCQNIIKIRGLLDKTLELAEKVVQPIVDKEKEVVEVKKEPKIVKVVHKAYKQEVGTINYIQVGTVNDKNQLIFSLSLLSESECKEKQQYQWKTYYSYFIYKTVWTYDNGETKEGEFKEFVPTNKIQEVESTDGRGVIGYVEHKAGIVEVIYYDRFVD